MVFVTDPVRTPNPWTVAQNLPPGAAVIYRAFGYGDALAVGRRLRAATHGRLLVGLDADLALAIGADGVHLPQRALAQATALRQRYPHWLISGAVHADAELELAHVLDFALIAPVFATGPTTVSTRSPLGREGFDAIATALACPALALGGVTVRTVADLVGTCAFGFAAVDAVQRAFGSTTV